MTTPTDVSATDGDTTNATMNQTEELGDVTNQESQPTENEERKSTGEELETSQEELQSMNEELVTVNGELKLKIAELSRANSALFNLMASTNVGVIFLDTLLQVKRFTPRATELFHLIEGDIGRPFEHISQRIRSGATGRRPLEMAQQVNETLAQIEAVVQSDNERWYILRLSPYRTLDQVTDGVVITLIDITDWQRAEHELQQRRQQQLVADLGRQALQGAPPQTLIDSATRQISALVDSELSAVFVRQPAGQLLLAAGVGWQPQRLGQAMANAEQNSLVWAALHADKPVLLGETFVAAEADRAPLLVEHGIVSGVSVTIGGRARPYGVLGVYSTQPHNYTQYDVDFLQAVANLLAEAITRHAQETQLAFQADVLEQVSEAVIAVDREERIIYLNAAAVAQYELDPTTAIGQPLSYAYRAEWGQSDGEFLADAALAEQGYWRGENRHIKRDGSPLHVEATVCLLRDRAGNVTGQLACIRNITTRKQTELALQATQARYRELTNVMPHLVWTANEHGLVDYYNIRVHDYDNAVWDGAYGFDWEQLLHPEDLRPTMTAWQQATANRSPYAYEHRLHMADGSWRWHLSQAIPVRDANNELKWYGTATDIHERKLAEERVRASEERLRIGTTVAGLAIAEVDYTTNLIHLSPEAATLFGLPADTGTTARATVHALFHPDDRAELFRRIDEALDPTGLGWFNMEHRIVRPDGQIRWLSVRKQIFFDHRADGPVRPVRALLAALDVTDHQVAEAALRASEERYRMLFATMDEGFCIFEMLFDEANKPVDYRFLEVNPAFERFTGLVDAVGKTARHLVPNLEAHWFEIYGTVALTGAPRRFIEGSAAMGRWFEAYAFRFGGPESRRVALLFNNITERKLIEDALRDSEEELRYTVEFNPQVPWTADPAGNIISFNRRWLDLTGMTEEEALGAGWMQAPHPEDQPAMMAAWTDAIRTGTPYDIEHRIRLANGDYRWMRARAFPRCDKSGAIVRWYGTTEDIHERKVAEETLRASEAFNRTTLESSPDCVKVLDAQGRLLRMNGPGLCLMEIDDFDPLVGQAWESLWPTDCGNLIRTALATAYTGHEGRFQGFCPTAKGTPKWWDVIVAPVQNDQGVVTHFIAASRDITEAKATEEALRENEARLQTILQNIPVSIYMLTLDQRYLYVNRHYEQLARITNAEIQGKSIYEMFTPEIAAALVANDQRALAAKTVIELEEYAAQDGVIHTYTSIKAPLLNADGEPYALLGISSDITERKQIEAALRASEARFRQLADAMPQIVWQADAAGMSLYFNQRWLEYTGLTPAESLADANRAIHPDDRAEAVRVWEKVRPLHKPYEYELRLRRADGDYRWHLVRCVPIHNDEGQLLCWYGTSTDIDAGKRATEALRASEERLRLATEAGGVGIFDHDLIANQTEVSTIYRQITGLPSEAVVTRESWLALVHPEDRSLVAAIWQEVQNTSTSYYYECRLLRPDGTVIWAEVNAWVTKDATGHSARITGAVRDITERKQAALHQQFLLDLNGALRTFHDTDAIQQTVVKRLGQYLGVDRCRFNAIDLAAGQVKLLAAWSQPGLPPPSPIHSLTDHTSAEYIAFGQAGRTLVVQDILQEAQNEAPGALLQNRGFRATIRVPCLREGRWVASVQVLQSTPRQWRHDEVQLVENVVHHFWPLVEKARTEEALRASEALFRAVQQASPDGYMIFESVRDAHNTIIDFCWRYTNPASEAMVGRAHDDLLGKRLLVEMPGNREEGLFDAYVSVVETGQVWQREFYYLHEGIDRWFRSTAAKAGDGFTVTFSDITERKRAEAALQQSNAILHGVLESSSDAIFVRDLSGRYLLVNGAGAAQIGLDKAAIIGQRYQDLFEPAAVAAIDQEDHPIVTQGLAITVEQVKAVKGIPRYWHTLKMPLRNAAGEVIGLISSARDLTERREMEEALRRNEARFRHLAEAMPQIVWTSSADGTTTYVNSQWLAYSQMTLADTLAQGMWPAMHPDDQAANRQQWLTALTTGTAYEGEVRLRRHDGNYRWFLERAIPVGDDAGTIQQWFGVSVDIHDRKEAERRQAELVAQVQENEHFLQSIAETTPNVIYLFDLPTLHNRYSNRQLAITLGYTPAEAQALGDRLLPTLLHPEDQAHLPAHLAYLQTLATGEVAEWEYRVQHKDGSWRWLGSRETVFTRDAQGQPVVILGAIQDITSRKEAEVALRARETELRVITDNIPGLISYIDQDGYYRFANAAYNTWYGWAPEAILGHTMQEVMGTLYAELQPYIERALQGEFVRFEATLPYRDATRTIWATYMPNVDKQGIVHGFYALVTDISERKQAEETIRRQLAEIEAIYATAPVGLAVLDTKLRYVRVNQQLAELNGIPAADHIGRTGHTIIPDVMVRVEPLLRQVIATRQPLVDLEIIGTTAPEPGVERIWLESFYPLCNELGEVVGINTMVQEITERKRQERHQQFLSALGLDLRLLNETTTILAQLVQRLGKYLQVAGCRVNEIDGENQQFTLQKEWVAADAPWSPVNTPGVYPLTELAPPAILAELQAGRTAIVTNTHQDARTAPVVATYTKDAIHSFIGVPIIHQGEWRATLSVKGHGARQWRPDEVTLLEDVAGQLSSLLEKVRAEEALRASEERLRLALAGGGMGTWESQVATNRSLWSPEEYALFGLPVGVEITDELFNQIVHPDDLPGLQAAMARLAKSGNDHMGEFRIIRPDGTVRWLADRVTVLRDESGHLTRLLGINFDITERKEREAMIRQQLAEIEAIYATAPVGLCLVDTNLRYVRINETLATLNRSTIAEQLGRTLAETQPAEGYHVIAPLYRQVIETGIPLLNQELHEDYVDPAQARDWLASYYPLKHPDGYVIGVNAVIVEITERKRQERQLQELNTILDRRVSERTAALEQANQALSVTNRELEQFTYAAAHDLRTPLRGIANLVQWINEDAAAVLPLASQRHLVKLGGRVNRLEKMLEDMLAYSRVGRVRYLPEVVDVQQLVQNSIDLLAPPSDFVITTTQLPTFRALRIPLELVFRNLVSNAIRHHHEPAHGRVEITMRSLDEWYEFCIHDNGPGIDPQFHKRIFGMFQTLKPRDEVEGSGIGLALVKKTLESVGGHIWVESALGQGTTFYFTWPKEMGDDQKTDDKETDDKEIKDREERV